MTNTVESTMKSEDLKDTALSFTNTEVAFSSKSDADLRKAHWLFKMIGNNAIMAIGKQLTLAVLALRLPVKGMIKATIFKQFCGGETIAECGNTTKVLDNYNIGTILDYSVEGKGAEADFKATVDELLRTIETADGNQHIPFCVFKVTGFCGHDLLEKISAGKQLSESEEVSKKIVLQRDFQGQDSWGAYKEQVAIDEKDALWYRESEGGNGDYGEWNEWTGEASALEFIFGELEVTPQLVTELKRCFKQAKALEDGEFNMNCY